jgi:hypothetical protein
VLTTDSQILPLDEVYVAQAWMSCAPNEFVHVELDAQEVRFT